MTDRKQNSLTIAVCVDVRQKAAREIVCGVMREARWRSGVDVVLLGNHPGNDGFDRIFGGTPDILVASPNMLRSFRPTLLRSRSVRAAVFFGTWGSGSLPYPHVSLISDDREIGEVAARVLVQSGLREFAYLGSPHGERWSMARGAAFAEALVAKGFGPVADYSPSAKRPDWRRERRRMAQWLESLPKPVGVFAAFDQRARHLLSVCREQGVPVPRQVQILGADDEDYLCENEIPPLSSLALDFRGAAESAMRALFAYLEEGAPMPETVVAGVAGLTERLSTCDNSRTGEWVNRARDVIRHHAFEGIGPVEVARRTGASLRLIEDAFKTVLGRTVAAELRETRLAEAARLLGETELPPGEIAARVGFGNPHSLMNAFKRRFGCAMRQWRKRELQ